MKLHSHQECSSDYLTEGSRAIRRTQNTVVLTSQGILELTVWGIKLDAVLEILNSSLMGPKKIQGRSLEIRFLPAKAGHTFFGHS